MNKIVNANLSELEWSILGQYSQGKSYQEVQDSILKEHGINLDAKKLGYKMGAIKRKTGCQTQFEMGYLYAASTMQDTWDNINAKHQIQLIREKQRKFKEGVESGYNKAELLVALKHRRKGEVKGFIAAALLSAIVSLLAIIIYFLSQ